MPSLRQLEYLVALSRERHFRRAAQKLGVSQPTLSAQLKAMEDRLGVELIERGRNAVLVTPLGEKVVAIAARMLQDRQEILDLGRGAGDALGGLIRLGLPSTIGPHLLPLILPQLHRSHPDLTLRVREDVPRNLPETLAAGGHDMLLCPLPLTGADIVTRPIFREPLHVAMAEDHPLAAHAELDRADLRGARVLTLERGHHLQEQVAAICEDVGAEMAYDFEGTSLDTLAQMAATGAGITFLPGLFVERGLHGQTGLAVRTIKGRHLNRTIGAAWRSTSSRTEVYELMVDLIRNAIARHFPRFMLL